MRNFITAYICNGEAPCGGKLGCIYNLKYRHVDKCCHTTEPTFAKNGSTKEPYAYPDRFETTEKRTGVDGAIIFWEKEEENEIDEKTDLCG